MARKTARKRRAAQPVKLWQLVLLVGLISIGYFYQQGTFDRWLAPYGLAFEPTPVALGGAEGPQVSLSKAVSYEGAWFQAFFTRPRYPENPAERAGGIDTAIAADIDSATTTVDLAVFDFDLPSLTEALLRARQRGIAVRMVIDEENLASPEVAEAIGRLEAAGVQMTYDTRSAFMHNKIILIDEGVAWTGSMNLTVNGVYRNDNNMIRSSLPPFVANYAARFNDLFAGQLGGQARANTPHRSIDLENGVNIQTYFSPSDRGLPSLLEAIATSDASVDVLAFSFTDDATAQALIDLHQQGVAVRVIMETRSIRGTGSEYATLEEAGIHVTADGNCYVAHNKVMIIDDQIVVTGSYNFTASAEKNNDENLLIIDDPELARYYSIEFERLWNEARNPQRCTS